MSAATSRETTAMTAAIGLGARGGGRRPAVGRLAGLALAALAALACLVARPAAVTADAKAADKAFRKGKKLQQQKKYAEACPAFEESFREDPAIGAQLNVARCYEEWGKLATAYDAYREAWNLAKSTKDDRAPQIRELMKELEDKVPTLVIALPKGRLPPPGLVVTLDGEELTSDALGKPRRVDPGAHVIVSRAAAGAPQTTEVDVPVGARVPVELPIDELAAPDEEPVVVPRDEVVIERAAPPDGRGRRVLSLVIGGAGLVGLGVATYVGLGARSDYNAAFDAGCDPVTKRCNPGALSATRDARSQANTATIIGGVALAAVATGVVLYVTAPRSQAKASDEEREREPSERGEQARYVRPVLLPGGAGVAFGGEL
jgi:serine/threonine-protein kinase